MDGGVEGHGAADGAGCSGSRTDAAVNDDQRKSPAAPAPHPSFVNGVGGQAEAGPATRDQVNAAGDADRGSSVELDCYQYTFSPLLLFAPGNYFDKGYSNYDAVARFFEPVLKPLGVDMFQSVLHEELNMPYDELVRHVFERKMLVTCCIDAHFTAVYVLSDKAVIYYDPLSSSLGLFEDRSAHKLVAFLLLKCRYGDDGHIAENKDYWTGGETTKLRRMIYKLWDDINVTRGLPWGCDKTDVSLNVDTWLLINGKTYPRTMSTQLTGNTCYFQTFLFGLLCRVCQPTLARGGYSVDLHDTELLGVATVAVSKFLLEFFVEPRPAEEADKMRPLTNSNVVIDFFHYRHAAYYTLVTEYLKDQRVEVPDYLLQYRRLKEYFDQRLLHRYETLTEPETMPSTPNTKSLQLVTEADTGAQNLARSFYYKFRAANLMFGFNTNITKSLRSFCEFNALRKNQLLAFTDVLQRELQGCAADAPTQFRDFYFMPQYEVGQPELVDVHHYTYLLDQCAIIASRHLRDPHGVTPRVHAVNEVLADHIFFSTQQSSNYDQFIPLEDFKSHGKYFGFFINTFMSPVWFADYAALGFSSVNPKEKDINSLTQSSFYGVEFMSRNSYRMPFEFSKQCINEMARTTLRKHDAKFDGKQTVEQKCEPSVKIGMGYTYSKYNTLMHCLNVLECYWQNPDITAIQVFGKDVRTVLAVVCQKVFFQPGHSWYHYGPFETEVGFYGREGLELAVGVTPDDVLPTVSRQTRSGENKLVLTDRVYEHSYLQRILAGVFEHAGGVKIKTDSVVLNLTLLALMLDFGLYEKHAGLVNLPWLRSLQRGGDTRELQVTVANLIFDFDKKNRCAAGVSRAKVEELLFETSYNFIVNKALSINSDQFALIQELNADPKYHEYVLLVRVYMSLCQINKSVEVDYYKVRTNGAYRIIIPRDFSRSTSEYLDEVTQKYTFSERDGIVRHGDLPVFDLRPDQPKIDLHKVRIVSGSAVESMVKYIEISNVFRAADRNAFLLFIAGNTLFVEVGDGTTTTIWVNQIEIEASTMFFNEAMSFVPCFKYRESEDVILFCGPHMRYLVDSNGQFCTDYYGMKHELIECIFSDEVFVDLSDEHAFKARKLAELVSESKTVFYYPDYLLQVSNRSQLLNLLDLSIKIRNISFFVLVLLYLKRCSVKLYFEFKDKKVVKISGPWKEAILYAHGESSNAHYDEIFSKQFTDLNRFKDLPLVEFIDAMSTSFVRYQQQTDGRYAIVPRPKQKEFLHKIISSAEPFHFSEVGSGKTKVILPLLCQAFLSNNVDTHRHFARGGKLKRTMVVLVPEHLLHDALAQVFRYCLNLTFGDDYRVYDDIFALLHDDVQLGPPKRSAYMSYGFRREPAFEKQKRIFVTSFNLFKKALTNDSICDKVWDNRESMLVVADEVDDFLDRDKLVFNLASNTNNDFDRPTLQCYFEVSRSVYNSSTRPDELLDTSGHPEYWRHLHEKYIAIHAEIQDASKSINKAFGIFNEKTLRHSTGNIAHDVEGYRSLIARPYESVNRAMPGSYYSDTERTIYLTFVVLMEDVAKYDELFQQERKFISYEYAREHVGTLDFDDLVYGHEKLSELVARHRETKDGLVRYLFEIILRRMEIRDKSRSVNSIDVVMNFDMIGFTGTPFIDNYPTAAYIRQGSSLEIPPLIDRSAYAFSCEKLSLPVFEERFTTFQGTSNNVACEYVSSDFIEGAADELAILDHILAREDSAGEAAAVAAAGLNVLVDLCGVFKRSSIRDVRDQVLKRYDRNRFHYVYHIDQSDGSDRVLAVDSDNDVQFDDEFYKFLCSTYGAGLREKVFFFVDNRNVIGKDIPFQLDYQRRFGQPMFAKSAVLAHDVGDFSSIWQAMGRSRTMNATTFAIYKSAVPEDVAATGMRDIKEHKLTQLLYIQNCDHKMAGNISSIYQTLISLHNLTVRSFYFSDSIVNVFLEKIGRTIGDNVRRQIKFLGREIFGHLQATAILHHILAAKVRRCAVPEVAALPLTDEVVEKLLGLVVEQKYEQRPPSGDVFDQIILYLSGEQQSLMEVSYTKQQQKQKQKQKQKNHDQDVMSMFDRKHQIKLVDAPVKDYLEYTSRPEADFGKVVLSLPLPKPIFVLKYSLNGEESMMQLFPTVQFLYSHHIRAEYITSDVKAMLSPVACRDPVAFCAQFWEKVRSTTSAATEASPSVVSGGHAAAAPNSDGQLTVKVLANGLRQNPLYSLAALAPGVYVIGMKDQFNKHDLPMHPLYPKVQYVADNMGFILYDVADQTVGATPRGVDKFGPYYIEQYILLEMISKQEVAQNVLDYYVRQKEVLQRGLASYSEIQGKGFVCWRFLINEAAKAAAAGAPQSRVEGADRRGRDDGEAKAVDGSGNASTDGDAAPAPSKT